MLVRMGESPEAYPHLKRIYPRIQVGKRSVRNVHEAKLRVEIIFAAQKVQPQRAARGEIYREVPAGTLSFVKSVPPPSSK